MAALTLPELNYVRVARAIAVAAHKGQVDKAGVEYINHPAWVAGRGDTVNEKVVGWLHDVLEDTLLTDSDLLVCGISEPDVVTVELLTRKPGQTDEEYYGPIRKHPVARPVKINDVKHNTLAHRLAAIKDDATRERLIVKYTKAMEMLTT